MELTLTRDCAIATTLLTSNGQTLYTIASPNKWRLLTTTITRHVLNEGDGSEQSSTELGRINWHSFGRSTRIIYNGKIMEVSKFMPREGTWTRARCFVAPDGRSYRWKMGFTTSYLERIEDAGDHIVVAKMRQANPFKKRKASLHIDSSASHFLDLLVITWVYIEHRRRGHGRHGHK